MTATPNPTPKPKPANPVEIVEFVEFTSTVKLAIVLALGLAIGVAVYYLATHVILEEADNARDH